jgi:hypothetical protein
MPQASLVFNLPEEREEYEIYCNAQKVHSLLWDLNEALRHATKYSDEEWVSIDSIRSYLYAALHGEECEARIVTSKGGTET